MPQDSLPRPFPGAVAVAALLLFLWIMVPGLNRIEITWHFWVGLPLALSGLIVVGFWGESPGPRCRLSAAIYFAVSLVLSFLLLGAALQLPPPPETPEAQHYEEEADPAEPSPTAL